MMLEERYNRMMAQVEPSDALVRRTLAAARPSPRHASTRKALLLTALCVLVVALPVLWKVLHTLPEPPRVTSANPLPTFTALPVKPPSDELTLSASDAQWEDDTTLTFLLTMRGDKVDSTTEFDSLTEGFPLSHETYESLDPVEGQPENEKRMKFIITPDKDKLLRNSKLPETLTLRVSRYTSGNTYTEKVRDIDWAAYDGPIERTGRPIMALGGGMSISGIGFNENGWLTIQVRKPRSAELPTHCYPIFAHRTDPLKSMGYLPWRMDQYSEGDYIYYNTAVSIPREELADYIFSTHTYLAGETIRGDWSVTVAIPPRPTE